MPRTWTDEQKRASSQMARQSRPWEKSTGPRSILGKQISSRNSYKHGRFSYEKQLLRWYIRLASLRLKQIKTAKKYALYQHENELITQRGWRRPKSIDIAAFFPYFSRKSPQTTADNKT